MEVDRIVGELKDFDGEIFIILKYSKELNLIKTIEYPDNKIGCRYYPSLGKINDVLKRMIKKKVGCSEAFLNDFKCFFGPSFND
jgi:hypothetical protein